MSLPVDAIAESSTGGGSRRRVVIELDPATIVTIALGVVISGLLLALYDAASDMLARVATGVVLALALDPIVGTVRRRFHCKRSLAVAVVGFGIVASFTLLVVVMGPPAVTQAEHFGKELPKTVRDMYDFPVVGHRLRDAHAADKVKEWAADLPAHVDTKTITRVTNAIVSGVAALFTVLIVAIGVLLDGELLVARVRRLIPPSRRDRADQVGGLFYRIVARYFAGSLLVAALAGLYVLAVGLALGVPLAPVAAVWVMSTNLIPQIGGFLGGALFVLLAVTQSVWVGVIVLVLFVAHLTFENHVMRPAIVGDAVNLSPPVTMLASLIGAAAIGVPGALIATPLAGTVKALYLEVRGDTAGSRTPVMTRRFRLPWRRRVA